MTLLAEMVIAARNVSVKSIPFGATIQQMDTSRIDLNLLVSLEVLLAERNVTKAASRLGLSQPALSAQLNRLRDLFEDPLLVPAHRGMIPTAKALELLEPLRASLDQFRKMLQSHDMFAPETAELKVAIACTDYVEATVAIPLILALRAQAPRIRVAVHRLNPPALARQLADGEVDFAIATPDPNHQDLRTQCLFEESYVLIVDLLGYMRVLEEARDRGRKYGVSMMLMYQSVGQLERHFGKDGAVSWIDGCAFASYAAIKALDTARNVSAQCGEMTVEVKGSSRNLGWGTKNSASRKSENINFQRRPLIMPHEITQSMRKDEQIIIVQGNSPIRCGRAIYFRRKDMDIQARPNRFAKLGP